MSTRKLIGFLKEQLKHNYFLSSFLISYFLFLIFVVLIRIGSGTNWAFMLIPFSIVFIILEFFINPYKFNPRELVLFSIWFVSAIACFFFANKLSTANPQVSKLLLFCAGMLVILSLVEIREWLYNIRR
jgi:peptidoglycan/LPS O-acetylase OafA/YrhL